MEKNNNIFNKHPRSKYDKIRLLDSVLQTEITRFFQKSQIKCKTIDYIKKFIRKSFYFNLISKIIQYIFNRCNEINHLVKTQLNLSHDITFHYIVLTVNSRIRYLNQILNLHLYSKTCIKFIQSAKPLHYGTFGCCKINGKDALIISSSLFYDIIRFLELKYNYFRLKRLFLKIIIVPVIKYTLTHELLHQATEGWDIFYYLYKYDFLGELINTFLELYVINTNFNYYRVSPFSLNYNYILSLNSYFPFFNILFWLFSSNNCQIGNFCVAERTTKKSSLVEDHEEFLTHRFGIIYQLLLSIKWIHLIKDAEWGKLVLEFEVLYKILIRFEFNIVLRCIHPALRFIMRSRLLNKINTHSAIDEGLKVFSFIIIIVLHLILKYFINSDQVEFVFRLLQKLNSWKNKKLIFRVV